MKRDESRGDDDGSKKRPFRCCVCRRTHVHKCYKCFCGKCPVNTKRVPPRYGSKDRSSDSQPFKSSSELGGSKETTVSDKVRRMDTSAMEQWVETSGSCTGHEPPPGFPSNPATLRSWPAIRSGTSADVAEDGHTKVISPNSRGESGSSPHPSIVKEQRGNDEVGNIKVRTNDGDGGPSKLHDGSGSIWDVLAEKETRASVSKAGWANKAGSASSWGTWPVNETKGKAQNGSKQVSLIPRCESDSRWTSPTRKRSRGSEEIVANTNKDGYSEPVLLKPHIESGSSRPPFTVKESKGKQEVMAYKTGDRSCKSVSRNPPSGSNSSWDAYIVKDAKDNADSIYRDQEAMANKSKDEPIKPVLNEHARSGSSSPSSTIKERRGNIHGNAEVTTYRAGDRSKQVLPKDHAQPGPSLDALTVKEPSVNAEATAYRAGSRQVLCNHHAQTGSRGDALTVEEPRGNTEVTTNRAGHCCKQVLHSHQAQPDSSWDILTVKEQSGNPEIMAYQAENGSSISSWHNPNAGFVSPPLSLTEKEPTGHSVSDKELDKDGEHNVRNLSKKLEGVVRADKKFIHPAVASPRHEKPPSFVISEKRSTQQNFFSSQRLDRVGPALARIWKGKFEILDFPAENRICEVFLAHLAANVCRRAYKFASQMTHVLQFNVHPRHAFWPKIFQSVCPDNRDVALYFYPQNSPRPRTQYARVLKLLERNDLMLRSVMGGVELLVFSSKLLHPKFQVLDDSLYLWGVFHKIGSKEVSCSTEVPQTSLMESAKAIANST